MPKCPHFPTLKPQKLANSLRQPSSHCPRHPQLPSILCLICGQTKCYNPSVALSQSQGTCAYEHWKEKKHTLMVELREGGEVQCGGCGVVAGDGRAAELWERVKGRVEQLVGEWRGEHGGQHREVREKDKDKKVSKTTSTNGQKQMQAQSPALRKFGLVNIGNTCFFNSILQCFYSLPQLHRLFSKSTPTDQLNQAFRKFLHNSQKSYNPKGMFSILSRGFKFLKSMHQQDAYQLYILMVDMLIEGMKQGGVGEVLSFDCVNRLQCLSCGKVEWIGDRVTSLAVPVERSHRKLRNKPKVKQQQITLPCNKPVPQSQLKFPDLHYPDNRPYNNFLDNYFSAQILTQQNQHKCHCGSYDAIQKFYIKTPPQVLVIALKRFDNRGEKLNTAVPIPEYLELQSHVLRVGRWRYRLLGGSVHAGTARGGHYVAYTRRGEEWWYFSDGQVKPAGSRGLVESRPYVLFYGRVEVEGEEGEDEDEDEEKKERPAQEPILQDQQTK